MADSLKKIREESDAMSSGWEQAEDVEFNGIKKEEFDADRTACRAIDDEIDDDEAAIKAKKLRRKAMYRGLDDKRIKIRRGVAGHKDYGENSPLYGSMGFVLESERKSGKTNKPKPPGGTQG